MGFIVVNLATALLILTVSATPLEQVENEEVASKYSGKTVEYANSTSQIIYDYNSEHVEENNEGLEESEVDDYHSDIGGISNIGNGSGSQSNSESNSGSGRGSSSGSGGGSSSGRNSRNEYELKTGSEDSRAYKNSKRFGNGIGAINGKIGDSDSGSSYGSGSGSSYGSGSGSSYGSGSGSSYGSGSGSSYGSGSGSGKKSGGENDSGDGYGCTDEFGSEQGCESGIGGVNGMGSGSKDQYGGKNEYDDIEQSSEYGDWNYNIEYREKSGVERELDTETNRATVDSSYNEEQEITSVDVSDNINNAWYNKNADGSKFSNSKNNGFGIKNRSTQYGEVKNNEDIVNYENTSSNTEFNGEGKGINNNANYGTRYRNGKDSRRDWKRPQSTNKVHDSQYRTCEKIYDKLRKEYESGALIRNKNNQNRPGNSRPNLTSRRKSGDHGALNGEFGNGNSFKNSKDTFTKGRKVDRRRNTGRFGGGNDSYNVIRGNQDNKGRQAVGGASFDYIDTRGSGSSQHKGAQRRGKHDGTRRSGHREIGKQFGAISDPSSINGKPWDATRKLNQQAHIIGKFGTHGGEVGRRGRLGTGKYTNKQSSGLDTFGAYGGIVGGIGLGNGKRGGSFETFNGIGATGGFQTFPSAANFESAVNGNLAENTPAAAFGAAIGVIQNN